MKTHDIDLLLGLLDGTLPAEQEREVRRRLGVSPELRAQLAELEQVRGSLRAAVERSASSAVRPLLSERVMGRLSSDAAVRTSDEEGLGYLSRFFRPVLAVGLTVGAALAFYNVTVASEYPTHGSVAERVLALPSLSTSAIYDLSDLSTNPADEQ